jgi:hypothetical protein
VLPCVWPLILVAAVAFSARGLSSIGFGGLLVLGFMAGFCLWGLGRIVFGPMCHITEDGGNAFHG